MMSAEVTLNKVLLALIIIWNEKTKPALLVEKGHGQVRIAKQQPNAVSWGGVQPDPHYLPVVPGSLGDAETTDKLEQLPGFSDLCYGASMCVSGLQNRWQYWILPNYNQNLVCTHYFILPSATSFDLAFATGKKKALNTVFAHLNERRKWYPLIFFISEGLQGGVRMHSK